MSSPIVKATIQAAILSALSNVLAQLISCYQAGTPYTIDPVPLGQFVTFSLLSCPPNYLWQQWLEAKFPGYTLASERGTTDSIANNAAVKSVTDKAEPTLEALNEKVTPALQAINEKTTPALQALNGKAAAATTAIQDSDVLQAIKRRATEGVETVKAKARELDARTGVSSSTVASKVTAGTRRFSTPDGETIEKKNDNGAPLFSFESKQPATKGQLWRPVDSYDSTANKKFNIKNTAIKFSLDQTIGAAANTVLFIAGIGALRGRPLNEIAASVRWDSVPLLLAGQKLWPAVSLISFTLIPVEKRTVFGGIVGVGWGIFLSLLAGKKNART